MPHDFPDEAIEGDDRALRLATTKDFRSVNIPMVVHVELEPTFEPGAPRRLFEGRYRLDYDITPDAQHFVMITRMHPALTSFNVVTNWASELERLVSVEAN